MSHFTSDQIAALSAKLDGLSVKKREGKYSYIEGWHAIAEANRIFGFDGWSRETVELRMVAEKPRKIGKGSYEKDGFGVGYFAKVRVTVIAGGRTIVREGCGYGSGIDADLGSAHESAIKEAETDAMKRALMTFGNPFGLALYDKDQENVEYHHAAPPPTKAPPDHKEDARRAFSRVKRDIETAETIFELSDVIQNATADLGLVKRESQDGYDTLMALATKRETAMKSTV